MLHHIIWMGKPFLNLLKDVAAHTAHRASGNVNERTQAIYDSITPPNELRNRTLLLNLALVNKNVVLRWFANYEVAICGGNKSMASQCTFS